MDRPFGLLAELTYALSAALPVLLQPAQPRRLLRRADDAGVAAGAGRGQGAGRAAASPVRRGAAAASRPGRDRTLRDRLGLYTNLVTSALGLSRHRAEQLRAAGLDHVQISIQADEPALSDRIAGTPSFERKSRGPAGEGAGLAAHRERGPAPAEHRPGRPRSGLAEELGADRIELANTQYYGWAWRNRDALLPSRAQLEHAEAVVRAARERLGGRMDVIYVVPDYYSRYPKPCMGGWGQRQLTVAPNGDVLPCPTAQALPFPRASVREDPLAWIWDRVPALPALPRNGLDAGAVPKLRSPRDRLRRMPLPGVPAHRRRCPHRPGLPPLPRPRARRSSGAGRQSRHAPGRNAPCPPAAPGPPDKGLARTELCFSTSSSSVLCSAWTTSGQLSSSGRFGSRGDMPWKLPWFSVSSMVWRRWWEF